jgi:CrcB protein
MNLTMIAWVAAGGALGSVARYLTMVGMGRLMGGAFPWGTLAVNILGSAVMGLLIEGMALKWNWDQELRVFLTVGILGGFTTFSTFSMDVALLAERGEFLNAALYIAGSVILSVLALFAAMFLARQVLA